MAEVWKKICEDSARAVLEAEKHHGLPSAPGGAGGLVPRLDGPGQQHQRQKMDALVQAVGERGQIIFSFPFCSSQAPDGLDKTRPQWGGPSDLFSPQFSC